MQDVSGRARELLEFLVILLSIAVAYKLGYVTLHSFIFANCISVKLMTLLLLSVYNKYSLTSDMVLNVIMLSISLRLAVCYALIERCAFPVLFALFHSYMISLHYLRF